ncbi:AAA family ATPase [Amycolatopsis rhabdoformis]|uniref:AAA family ATPase n=1 Tax=Amycolatopsis rhabdoformis TaxID=1448059 RepID=A0ABZ1IHJ1_9PSEU|nr:AAA family ATPase [Amycolatopsis rhabdoformis]WSE32905.1 AAA family ATPase [Amycolatopsis rhabdoformis]
MLLEREPELAVLEKAVLEVQAGEGAVLLVGGPAGAGSTALLRELAAASTRLGARVLRAGGAQIEQGFPLGVVRQLVLPLLSAEDPAPVPPVARALLDPLTGGRAPVVGEDQALAETAGVLHGLHTLFVGLAAQRPVVVLVDDLHWVDEPSLRALAFLAGRLAGTRVLIAAVLQDGAGGSDPLIEEIVAGARCHLRVAPLSADATARLVAREFGPDHAPRFATACHEVTSGSPKELRTLLDRALSHRVTGKAADCERIRELGTAFRRERVQFLLRRAPGVAAFAKALVVLGGDAELELVLRLGEVDAAGRAAALSALGDRWLTVSGDRVAVRDPSLNRVVEELLDARESSALHRKAAGLLDEGGYPPEAVAAQLLQVDVIHAGWEVERLRAAAQAARRRAAPSPAGRYLRRALLDLPPDSGERARLLVELAAAELDVDPGSGVRHLAQAAPLLPTVRERATVATWIPLPVAGEGPLVAELVREVAGRLGPAEELSGHEREVALRLEARVWFSGLGEPARLAAAARRLAELRDHPHGPTAGERELRVVLLMAATLGSSTTADVVAAQARRLLAHDPTNTYGALASLQTLPAVLMAADAVDAGWSWLDAAYDNACRHSNPTPQALVGAQRGLLLLGCGRLVEARAEAVRAFDLVDRSWPDAVLLPSVVLGLVAFALRDRPLAARVLDSAPPGDLRLFEIRRSLRGALAAQRGDLPMALAQFLDSGRRLDRAGWYNPAMHSWRTWAAVLSHRMGRQDDAVRLAEDNYERALHWGAPTTLGRALRIRASVHPDRDRALELLREADEVLRTSVDRFEQAKALIKLGEVLRDVDRDESERVLARGRRLAEQCGAHWLGAEADGLFAAQPGSAVSPVIRSELTRGEATVAGLAARGLTNTDIADELGTSRRAVEKHLTSAYRKLRIDGRADLAAALGADPENG